VTILVIAEHDNATLGRATHSTVGAAALIATFTGLDVHVLVAGCDAQVAAEAATRIAGVSKVIFADVRDTSDVNEVGLEQVARGYSRILVPATGSGLQLASCLAEKLGVVLIRDVTGVLSADTFERTEVLHRRSTTQRSRDAMDVMTVMVDAFDAAASEGGGATLHRTSAEETRRSRYASNLEVRRPRCTPGIEERHSARFSQAKTFKALSDKLETAIAASRVFHERLRLKRYSCVD
jgi:electron transfer flavoprotein alpha subunit